MKQTRLLQLFCLLSTGLLFISCQDEPEIYTPDKNLTSSQIIQLIYEAFDATNSEIKVTEVISSDDLTFQKTEVDRSTKRALFTYHSRHQADDELSLKDLQYVEGDSKYEYNLIYDEESFTLRYTEDLFWDSTFFYKTLLLLKPEEYDSWTVSGDKLIGTIAHTISYNPSSDEDKDSATLTQTINLDNKKRFKQVEFETSYLSVRMKTLIKYQYTANPKIPDEFSKDFFTRIPQYALHINWGNRNGTKKYLSENTDRYEDIVHFSISRQDAPVVEGKVPVFYEDALFRFKIESTRYDANGEWYLSYSIPYDSSGKTIYAKWIPISEAKN